MIAKTPNYKLNKPEDDDFFDVEHWNENMDKIDKAIKQAAEPEENMKGAAADKDGAAGLVPLPKAGEQEKYLRADGTWQTPLDTKYPVFKGATEDAAGEAGLVPVSSVPNRFKYLRGDGHWVLPPDTKYDVFKPAKINDATMTDPGTSGLVPAPHVEEPHKYFLSGDGTWKELLIDTGWVDLGINTNTFKLYNASDPVQYRKVGNMVTIRGVVSPAAQLSGDTGQEMITILPEDCRPSRKFYAVCQGTGINRWLLTITTAGLVSFSRYGADEYGSASTSVWLPFEASFYID